MCDDPCLEWLNICSSYFVLNEGWRIFIGIDDRVKQSRLEPNGSAFISFLVMKKWILDTRVNIATTLPPNWPYLPSTLKRFTRKQKKAYLAAFASTLVRPRPCSKNTLQWLTALRSLSSVAIVTTQALIWPILRNTSRHFMQKPTRSNVKYVTIPFRKTARSKDIAYQFMKILGLLSAKSVMSRSLASTTWRVTWWPFTENCGRTSVIIARTRLLFREI